MQSLKKQHTNRISKPRIASVFLAFAGVKVLADGDCVQTRDCSNTVSEWLDVYNGIRRTALCLAEAGFCKLCDGAKTYDRICCYDRCAACLWDKIAKCGGYPSFYDVSPLMSWLRRSGGRLECRFDIPGEGRLWQAIMSIELCAGSGHVRQKIRVSLETLRPDRIIMARVLGADFDEWRAVADGVVEVRRGLRQGFCSCAPPSSETICCAHGARFCNGCALRQIFARE